MIGQKKQDFVSFAEKRRFLFNSSSFMATCSHDETIKFDVACPICGEKMVFVKNITENAIELACVNTSVDFHGDMLLRITRRK